jgi:hypothetical protein
MDRFDPIAEHLKVLADGFHPIADGKKVFADRKKVNRRRFRVCGGSCRVPTAGLRRHRRRFR